MKCSISSHARRACFLRLATVNSLPYRYPENAAIYGPIMPFSMVLPCCRDIHLYLRLNLRAPFDFFSHPNVQPRSKAWQSISFSGLGSAPSDSVRVSAKSKIRFDASTSHLNGYPGSSCRAKSRKCLWQAQPVQPPAEYVSRYHFGRVVRHSVGHGCAPPKMQSKK